MNIKSDSTQPVQSNNPTNTSNYPVIPYATNEPAPISKEWHLSIVAYIGIGCTEQHVKMHISRAQFSPDSTIEDLCIFPHVPSISSSKNFPAFWVTILYSDVRMYYKEIRTSPFILSYGLPYLVSTNTELCIFLKTCKNFVRDLWITDVIINLRQQVTPIAGCKTPFQLPAIFNN
jgi:hypothetical protein